MDVLLVDYVNRYPEMDRERAERTIKFENVYSSDGIT